MMRRVTTLLLLLLLLISGDLLSQVSWYNPAKAEFNPLEGIALIDEARESPYHRIPDSYKGELREPVWALSKNTAGVTIGFRTNSKSITVRYKLTAPGGSLPHMPNTGSNGLDLYAYNAEGENFRVVGNYNFSDTVSYNYSPIEYRKCTAKGYEYELYLPAYNGVKWLEIGVTDGSVFEFVPRRKDKPIVLYGTSIAQGACASRPGMIWSSILKRAVDMPLINLGFSGNGKLETPIIDMMAKIDAVAYLIDCMPNLQHNDHEELVELIVGQVKRLRSVRPDTPILLMDHLGYSAAATSVDHQKRVENTVVAQKKAFDQLTRDGVKGIYHITNEDLNMPYEAIVDYVHPSDLGMQIYADRYEKSIREILNMPVGDCTATRAVRQRREPAAYEWMDRQGVITSQMNSKESRSIFIGNSIIHQWGGVEGFKYQRADQVWQETFGSYVNMGCGWDRTENVIWRLERGALDGAKVDEAFVKIGTNNLSVKHSDGDILKGIERILDIIHDKQPGAKVILCGILPRRGMESRVATLNGKIKALAERVSYVTYLDLSDGLLLGSGKLDESMYRDGLHPNREGYEKIAASIERFRAAR